MDVPTKVRTKAVLGAGMMLNAQLIRIFVVDSSTSATSSYSFNSPLSPFHNSLSLSLPAQDLPFSQIFPTIDSLPASGLTPRLYDWTVSCEHLGFSVTVCKTVRPMLSDCCPA